MKEDNNSLTLLLTGDLMISKELLDFRTNNNLDIHYPFTKFKHIFSSADIVFSNLESAISKDGPPMRPNTGPLLYSPPEEIISTYRYLNCNVISIGNNHINDFGEKGIINTRKTLEENGFYVFGAGKNNKEANNEAIIEKNNIKIAFLGYTTDNDRDGISPDIGASIATIDKAGCIYYDIKKIKEDIKRISVNADIICISLHWGYEYFIYPSPKQMQLAHQIIDAGANIIIGHHPHIVQAIEKYKQGVIFYSLGNFFFPKYLNLTGYPNENNKFIIGKCKINKSQVTGIEIIPGYLDTDYQLKFFNDKERNEYLSKFETISKQIQKSNYNSFWEDYKKKRKKFLNRQGARYIILLLFKQIREEGFKGLIKNLSWKYIRHYTKQFAKNILGSFN